MIGTAFQDDLIATGFGAHLALPLMRKALEETPSHLMEEGAARALLEDCLRVLFYRDCRALNRVQLAKATADGVLISPPYELETNWDSASFVLPKAGSSNDDGGW